MYEINRIPINTSVYNNNQNKQTIPVNNAKKTYIAPKTDVVSLSLGQDIMTTQINDTDVSFWHKFQAQRNNKKLEKSLLKEKDVKTYYDQDFKQVLVRAVPAGKVLKINDEYVKTEQNEGV